MTAPSHAQTSQGLGPSSTQSATTRVLRAAWWITPILVCIAIYWLGMRIWFQQDDFAWLGLRNHVHDFRSFLWAMFAPMAQGTIRPLSERGFFMLFSSLFGLRALPYRLFVFLNQFLNLVLLMLVTRKLTRSDLAGLLAPVLWLCSNALITPMAWSAAYNEIQCTTFLLSSFYLFLLYTETGQRKFYWAQLATFVLGFGSLEINVVFPALAAAYAILFARRYFRSTLPLFAISAIFAVVHRTFSARSHSFYYDMSFHPAAILKVLSEYWNIMLGFSAYTTFWNWHSALATAAVALITAAILGFVALQARRRRYLPLFFLSWFLIVLAPLLPLHNHITDYYVMIPALGIAMLCSYAMSVAWRSGWAWTTLCAALILLYAVPSAAYDQQGMRFYFDRADRCRALVQSVAYAKHIHPGKIILLKGVDHELFWGAIYDSSFHVLGWDDVFLTPETRAEIQEDPHLIPLDQFFLPASAVVQALNARTALVYEVEGRRLRNITRPYTMFVESQPPPPLARSINLGQPYFNDQVGEGWFGIEQDYRWSKQHAVVYLPGPSAAGQKLRLHCFASDQQLKSGPLQLALTVDGEAEPVKTLSGGNEFRLEYDLPARLLGKPRIEVAFTLDRTFRPPNDSRDLGLAFGEMAIR